jgi:hypothetical protein
MSHNFPQIGVKLRYSLETEQTDLLRRLLDKLRGPKHPGLDLGGDDCAQVFAQARAEADGRAASASTHNQVAIVSPSGGLLFIPAPLPESVSEAQIARSRNLLPPEPRRIVAVIADTRVSGSLTEINNTIPFVGMLVGLAYIGHCVTVFDGKLSRIAQGCRDADVLIVDDAVLPHLPDEWYATARQAMRSPGIYVHDRKAYALRPILPNPKASD